jgi:hypothetical protein
MNKKRKQRTVGGSGELKIQDLAIVHERCSGK